MWQLIVYKWWSHEPIKKCHMALSDMPNRSEGNKISLVQMGIESITYVGINIFNNLSLPLHQVVTCKQLTRNFHLNKFGYGIYQIGEVCGAWTHDLCHRNDLTLYTSHHTTHNTCKKKLINIYLIWWWHQHKVQAGLSHSCHIYMHGPWGIHTFSGRHKSRGGVHGSQERVWYRCIILCAKRKSKFGFLSICMPWGTLSKHSDVYTHFSHSSKRSSMVLLFLW